MKKVFYQHKDKVTRMAIKGASAEDTEKIITSLVICRADWNIDEIEELKEGPLDGIMGRLIG